MHALSIFERTKELALELEKGCWQFGPLVHRMFFSMVVSEDLQCNALLSCEAILWTLGRTDCLFVCILYLSEWLRGTFATIDIYLWFSLFQPDVGRRFPRTLLHLHFMFFSVLPTLLMRFMNS